MKFYSPLRYPGGKNKLAKFVALVCKKNNIDGHYIEPYAGGASVGLYLLFNDYVKEITINDLDRSIYSFWYSILHNNGRFCDEIEKVDVSVENWKKFRIVQGNKDNVAIFDLGLSTFFLNRTNMSGIINGGIIGGYKQKSSYKIDCRFNKKNLIDRIKKIGGMENRIHLENLDAIDLIKKLKDTRKNNNTIFYFDPPYYSKGKSLYMNYYGFDDHMRVSKEIKKIKNTRWIVSYDNVPEIQELYKGLKKKNYSYMYTAHKPKEGRETLFFSNNLAVPRCHPIGF